MLIRFRTHAAYRAIPSYRVVGDMTKATATLNPAGTLDPDRAMVAVCCPDTSLPNKVWEIVGTQAEFAALAAMVVNLSERPLTAEETSARAMARIEADNRARVGSGG